MRELRNAWWGGRSMIKPLFPTGYTCIYIQVHSIDSQTLDWKYIYITINIYYGKCLTINMYLHVYIPAPCTAPLSHERASYTSRLIYNKVLCKWKSICLWRDAYIRPWYVSAIWKFVEILRRKAKSERYTSLAKCI